MGRVSQRPVPSETTCFVVRNRGAAVCGKSIIFSRWWNRAFRKRAIFEVFCVLLLLKGVFFRSCRPVSWQQVKEVDRRKTLQNKGFRSDFASFYLFYSFDILKRLDFADLF